MTPNLAAGKTELMLVFQGKGARGAKIKYFGPTASEHLPVLTEVGLRQVRVVTSYTHLGCTIHHRGDVRKEVKRRVCIAHEAFNHHRRLLFQNKQLTTQRRAELFRTLILSKLLYGGESWVTQDLPTRQYAHAALMRLYRHLLPGPIDHLSDQEVLWHTGLPDPSDLLRQCRLRHRFRVRKPYIVCEDALMDHFPEDRLPWNASDPQASS